MNFSKVIKYSILALLSAALSVSCVREQNPDLRDSGYGYVQFKLYKDASYTKASGLEYLRDASKVMVMLRYGDVQISQTLTLSASDSEAAEYGLRSAKLKLLTGEYEVIAYTVFNKLDEDVYKGGTAGSFEVVEGGLAVHDLTADVVARGKAKFAFIKYFASGSKASAREYTFDEVASVDLRIHNEVTSVRTELEDLKTVFSTHFYDKDEVEDGYITSSLSCDSEVSLRAGRYVVDTYNLKDKNGDVLELASPMEETVFEIQDNRTTEVEVPVTMNESAEYIKDYAALKEIWESLDGENWYYFGEDWTNGSNWDFNKSPDLWGDQPGVQLHSNGRVALINISDFGFRGDLSPAIGQLSELVELYLGSHNDLNIVEYDPTMERGGGSSARMERHKKYLSMIHPLHQLSEPVARALKEHNISIPEIALYDRYTEAEILVMESEAAIVPMDISEGKFCNGLTSLPAEIGKLTKLERLYIANGELQDLPATMGNMKSLLELEIYNCPKMLRCPEVIGDFEKLEVLNMGNNPQLLDGEPEKVIDLLSKSPAAATIQILYLNKGNMQTLDGAAIAKMKKLGLLDLSDNRIDTITEAFGNEVGPVQLYLNNNLLSSFPVNSEGVFCKMDDIETFSVSNNLFTEFPDIFSSESIYTMGSVDFSFNHISGFQNENSGYKGINVTTLTLNNNPELTKYPACLAKSKSIIANIAMRGCSLEEFEEGCFEGEKVVDLQSLDLSYNHLTKLSGELIATNAPYFYGLDISYNRLSKFPTSILDCSGLTVLGVRGQRDADGNRCLSEWPTGIYKHKGLRGLYLGSNNLGKIDDTISTLIYFLDISDNPEIIFDASDICTAYANQVYYLIYDKSQEIRNCEYIALD
ncbi:MAG: DUF4458 domain-containing protein [Candidatus Cryptobacteroides sp.]